ALARLGGGSFGHEAVPWKKRGGLLPDGLAWPLAGARVGSRALATRRQATPVAQPAVGAQVHQALDADGDLTAQVAFHREAPDLAALRFEFVLGQFADLALRSHASGRADAQRAGGADPENGPQRDVRVFLVGD